MPENQKLEYSSTGKRKGVLGTLEGVCADCIHTTRNGRLYSNELWEKAFKNPIVQEHFQCGGIFGQLGHPKDDQTENEEFNAIAICMPEPPVKGKDGKLRGRWDILDTPNGKILKCLCDYGYKIGISSRGDGEITEDYDGNESVEPDTYEFKAFDAVLLPAVKAARLNLVTESLDQKDKKFKKAIKESLDSVTDLDRASMIKTLSDLGIDYVDSSEIEDESHAEVEPVNINDEAVNDGAELVVNLQNALQEVNELQAQIFDLNEKISAGITRESKLESQKAALAAKLQKAQESINEASALRQQLLSMKEQLENQIAERQRQVKLTEAYKHKLEELKAEKANLTEAVTSKTNTIRGLQGQVQNLTESSSSAARKDKKLIESLQKEISELKTDSQLKHSQYSDKLNESVRQIERYKNIAKTAVDKYIECKATAIGVSKEDVKSRLNSSCSFGEIDKVCESLRRYNLNISKLPFQVGSVKKVAVKENLQERALRNPDDVVDDSLLNLLT